MYWWVLDIIIVALLAAGFIIYLNKGLLAAVVSIAGTALAILIAFWGSGELTPYVYDGFVKDKLVSYVQEKLVGESENKLSELLGTDVNLGALFPEDAAGAAAESGVGEAVAEGALGSTARSIVRTLLAIVIFFLALLIIRLIVSLLKKANKIPVLGAANKLLGGALGLAMGALWSYIFVSACALAIKLSLNSLSWLNTDMVDRTLLFSLIYPHNLLNLLAAA